MSRQQRAEQFQALFRTRTLYAFLTFAGLFGLIVLRLVYLQGFRHSYFQKEADAYRVSKSLLPASRGLILDRNGDPLAINEPANAIFADPLMVQDPAGTAAKLSPILGDTTEHLTKLLTARSKKNHYVTLKRHVETTVGAAVKTANLPGVGILPDTLRAYPNQEMAAQLLGFTNRDGKGIEGLEHSQDKLLSGVDGIEVAEIDREGRFLPGTERHRVEPQNGHDITLTIDRTLQAAADSELAKAVADHHAQCGVVVMLDPRTGEILAMSNMPGYNPNKPRPATPVVGPAAVALAAEYRDIAVSNVYEPGSTMKTITSAAVLQEEGPGELTVHVHCSGQMQVGNHIIHCAKDPPYFGVHGDETLRDVLKNSCNIGIAQFAFHLGAERLYKYEKLFGFLDYPGSGLPGEERCTVQSPDKFNHYTGSTGWSQIQLANIAFGQGISVTPLQLAAAYGAIANDGVLMRPHIVRSIGNGANMVAVAPTPIRRVVDPTVAAEVRSLLGTVVQDGTGKPAQIAGFSVGGKTGSAQVAGPKGYEEGHYVSSFIGMVPLSHPRVVILCSVFEPQGVHWGAAVAAPVVHNLSKDAMLMMHVPPDDPGAVDWADHLKVNRHPGEPEPGDFNQPNGQIQELGGEDNHVP